MAGFEAWALCKGFETCKQLKIYPVGIAASTARLFPRVLAVETTRHMSSNPSSSLKKKFGPPVEVRQKPCIRCGSKLLAKMLRGVEDDGEEVAYKLN